MPNNSSLPDYYERDFEYDAPEYLEGTSQSVNLKLYRDWRTLWAQRLFHEACEDYNWRRPKKTYVHVSEYPYHPGFAEAFATLIGGIHEDGSRLALADVEYSLEKWYGSGLERPDCDYLADILEDIGDSAQFPKNIERALQWLATRKANLPLWPHSNSKKNPNPAPIPKTSAKAFNADVNANASTLTAEIDIHKLPIGGIVADQDNSRSQQHEELDSNPFDDILYRTFPFEALTQLLHNLHLVDPATGKAHKGAKGTGKLRVVIFALRDKKCIVTGTSAASISSAFKKVFMANISESYIRKERKNSKSLLTQSWQLEVYNNCIHNIDVITNNGQ